MNTGSNKPTTQIASQDNNNAPVSPDIDSSHQNRSGIMDNNMGQSDEIFEDQNVPSEGQVGNTGDNPDIKGDETGIKETEGAKAAKEYNDDGDEMDDKEVDEADEDFDSIENDLNDADLDDNALEDSDDIDDLDEDG